MNARRLILWCLALALSSACSSEPVRPVEGDACADILDCALTPQLACSSGVCARIACDRSNECPVGAACVQGLCGAPVCATSEECSEGSGCFEGDCVEGLCEGKEDCAQGQVCLGAPPRCAAPPDICSSAEQCPLGAACKLPLARCVSSCEFGQACPDGMWCDGAICRGECEDSDECDPGERCARGRCQPPRDCSGELTCPTSQPIRDPVTCECLECLDDLDCAVERGEACAGSTCVFCDVRGETASVCEAIGLEFFDGCCLECTSEGDCEVDEACDGGRCIDLLEQRCVSDSDCREGLVCDGDRCVQDASLSACEVQGDCPEQEACYGDGRCRAVADVCQACPAPSRCVAEVGDMSGTCAGCSSHCQPMGCASGQLCRVPEGASEGYCVDESFWQGSCR